MRRLLVVVVVALLAGGALADPFYDLDVEKYQTPDVDKPGVPPVPNNPPNDGTCWVACASNLLGGGGWGCTGTPQQRADRIYNTMRADIFAPPPGTWPLSQGGWMENAINYWLYTYGLNPDSEEFYQRKGAPQPPYYTDVTVVDRWPTGLTEADYNTMLAELDRCQYITVGFDDPAHCLTMVGGQHGGSGVVSVYHDSDRDLNVNAAAPPVVPGDEQYYETIFNAGGFDLLPIRPSSLDPLSYNLEDAWNYVMLCPGLVKPCKAVANYDVAYYAVPDPDDPGDFDPGLFERGRKKDVYEDPIWRTDTILRLDNEAIPDLYKEVWLLVDYTDQVPGREDQENILLNYYCPDTGLVEGVLPTSITPSEQHGQLLFYWQLPCQPEWEEVLFPDNRYNLLWDMIDHPDVNVKDWNIATICIPEPTTVVLLGAGLLAVLRRRKRT